MPGAGPHVIMTYQGTTNVMVTQTAVVREVPVEVFYAACSLSGAGCLLTTVFIIFNHRYRGTRIVRMSSPNVNLLLSSGAYLAYLCCILTSLGALTYVNNVRVASCQVLTWLLPVAFTLTFGAMFTKSWRVRRIFLRAPHKKVVVKDHILFAIVLGLLIIDLVILTSWQAIDPPRIRLIRETVVYNITNSGTGSLTSTITQTVLLRGCVSQYSAIWLSAIFVYKTLVLLYGVYLSWTVRAVTLPAMNDTTAIILSSLLTAFVSMATAVTSVWFHYQPEVTSSLIMAAIWVCTTVTLCLNFIPKMQLVWKKTEDELLRVTMASQVIYSPNQSLDQVEDEIYHLVAENRGLKKALTQREQKIKALQEHVTTAKEKLESLIIEDKQDSGLDADMSSSSNHDDEPLPPDTTTSQPAASPSQHAASPSQPAASPSQPAASPLQPVTHSTKQQQSTSRPTSQSAAHRQQYGAPYDSTHRRQEAKNERHDSTDSGQPDEQAAKNFGFYMRHNRGGRHVVGDMHDEASGRHTGSVHGTTNRVSNDTRQQSTIAARISRLRGPDSGSRTSLHSLSQAWLKFSRRQPSSSLSSSSTQDRANHRRIQPHLSHSMPPPAMSLDHYQRSRLRDSLGDLAHELHTVDYLSSALCQSLHQDLAWSTARSRSSVVYEQVRANQDIAGSIVDSYDLDDVSDTYSCISNHMTNVPSYPQPIRYNRGYLHSTESGDTSLRRVPSIDSVSTIANDRYYPSSPHGRFVKRGRHSKRLGQRSGWKREPKPKIFTVFGPKAPKHAPVAEAGVKILYDEGTYV